MVTELLSLYGTARSHCFWIKVHQHSATAEDRKSTRLNSSHVRTSYAVFCLKKKIRYTQNSISRSKMRHPTSCTIDPPTATSYIIVAFYVAQCFYSTSDLYLAAKGLGSNELH